VAVGGERLIHDETRPLSRSLWLRALEEFSRLRGKAALREIGPHFLEPEMLGVWAEVLRGAQSPAAIFSQLSLGESLPGEPAWRSFREQGGTWMGEIQWSTHDTPNAQELVAEALRSEVETLPALVGFRGRATLVSAGKDFRIEVQVEDLRRPFWRSAALAAGLPLAYAAAQTLGSDWQPRDGLTALGIGAATTTAVVFLQWDARRRRESRVQSLRIMALERESSLRRERPREISRPHAEPILAAQYRIGEQLGVGGSGAVWHAIRLRDGVPVAIKLIRTGVAHDVRATDRLRREAEALGLAWHPHVVEIYESGILPSGVAYLAMERLYGESLAERLLRTGPLDYAETRRVALELSEALTAIHSAGLVHRDIKPGNLFLHRGRPSAEGAGAAGDDTTDLENAALASADIPPSGTSRTRRETIKVIDFGVARISWAETRLTRSGTRIGTVGYAAPEQERGDDVDGRADLYAVGITLRECLTGVGPPGGLDAEAPRRAPLPVPFEFDELITSLTQVDPAGRPRSARDFRDWVLRLPEVSEADGDLVEGPESPDRPSPRPKAANR
jgi:serine/threonine protein kinase